MFNLFQNILSASSAGKALGNTGVFSGIQNPIAPVTQAIGQSNVVKKTAPIVKQAGEEISTIAQPFMQSANSMVQPIKKEFDYTKKIGQTKSKYATELMSLGLTAKAMDEMGLSEEEKQAVKAIYDQVGAKIPGLEEQAMQQQAIAQEQARQGEGLGFFGSIKEGAIGIGQAGMYLPELAGNVGSMIPGALGEIAGYAGSALGVERENNPFYTSLKEGQRATQRAGQMVTGAGVDSLNLTEKQKEARRTGAMLALTAPVPVKGLGLIKGTGIGATALRGGLAGAQGTAAYTAASEGKIPTAPELAIGTAGGAVLGPVLEKAVIPGIAKGAEMVNRKLNPSKFVHQIDDETIGLVRKAVRPSVTGVDSVSKFDVQDEKLLQGVKEVVKQGKKPKNARELMDAVADTKKAIWAKVQESNKAVVKTTSGDEIATKVRNIVNDSEYDELFANNPSLEAELLRFADDVVTNKRFQNLSQEKLQNYLVDINGRLPQTAFQKSLASNPTQTAKDTLIAKVYKEILDDNLEQAVGMAGKETRMAYGAVRQLEKDFAKRYAVYLRQNPQGLADMFGMEGFADMAVGLLTGSPAQVGRGVVMQGVKRLIKSQNNPDTIIRDIFNLQSKLKNVKSPIVKPKTPLLPARTSTTPEPIVTPQTSSRALVQESKKGLSPNIKRPNGTPIRNSKNNTSSANTQGSKQVIVSPKKQVEKTVKASDKYDIFDEDTKNSIFVYKPKGYSIPKNSVIYPSESGIGVSYKGKGRVDFYISTKDGRIKVSTDNLGANQIDFIQNAWKKVGKDMEQIYEKSLSQQKTVKPKKLTK